MAEQERKKKRSRKKRRREEKNGRVRRKGGTVSFFQETLKENGTSPFAFYAPQTPSPRFANDPLSRCCFGSAAHLLSAALCGELCAGERAGERFLLLSSFSFSNAIARHRRHNIVFPFLRVARPMKDINYLFSSILAVTICSAVE